jgi:hypothetical protein
VVGRQPSNGTVIAHGVGARPRGVDRLEVACRPALVPSEVEPGRLVQKTGSVHRPEGMDMEPSRFTEKQNIGILRGQGAVKAGRSWLRTPGQPRDVVSTYRTQSG